MSVFRSKEANGTLAAPPPTTSNRKRIVVKGKDKIKKENRIKKQEERNTKDNEQHLSNVPRQSARK